MVRDGPAALLTMRPGEAACLLFGVPAVTSASNFPT
jgi:hypothetical protein